MTKAKTHAEQELEILARTTPDAIVLEFKDEIISLCEKFGKSGQSGGSAPVVASVISQAINTLLLFQTIAPLTGENNEWIDVSAFGDELIQFQNKRDSRVFKTKTGKSFFIDAIVFDGNIGGKFTSTNGIICKGIPISSTQYIKSFPFTPKTFYIDVIDYRWKDKEETQPDENGDWWTHTLKDELQLEEVFKYYDTIIHHKKS